MSGIGGIGLRKPGKTAGSGRPGKPKRELIRLDEKSSFAYKEEIVSGTGVHWHFHPELELSLVLQGKGLRFVGDTIAPFQDGDLCLLGPDLPHACPKPEAGLSLRTLVIQFPAVLCGEGLRDFPEMRSLRRLLDRSRHGVKVIGATRRQAAEEMQAIGRMPDGSIRRAAKLISLLGLIAESDECRTLARGPVKVPIGKNEDHRFRLIFDLIRSNLPETLSERDIAERIGLSPGAFSHFFKRALGKTYLEYVGELRVGMACRALLETDKSIPEAAGEAGFRNLANFYRQFRRHKGSTPGSYRLQSVGNAPW
jgi:AraC-like DNA-binding protein